MSKVEILTIHFGINHGSVLQCYALSRTLEDLGAEVEVIDYVPSRYKMWNNVVIKFPEKSLLWKVAYFFASSIIRLPQKLIFRSYLKRHIILSRRFSTQTELSANPPSADLYLVGSDQVWNSVYNGRADMSYFLGFAGKEARRASYAASIGRDQLDEGEGSELAAALDGFLGISVREARASELLSDVGVRTRVDLDPVFLFSRDRWMQLASRRGMGQSYVLVYVIAQNYADMISQAREVADRLDCRLYVLSVKPIRTAEVDKNFIFSDPSDFLSLFSNARFVISNSFHGTAFSIIFHRDFLTYATKYNSRIENILHYTGLEDRLVRDRYSEAQIIAPVQFENADRAISAGTSFARQYLQGLLEVSGE